MPKYRLTIGVAESVTCGQLQARIGKSPNVAEVFKGGITAYSIDQKVKQLGVDAAHATRTHCVSPKVTDEMAIGVCSLFGVEVGVSTTGYADPPRKGVAPYGFWSLCRNDGSCLKIVKRGKVIGAKNMSRAAMQSKIAAVAFKALVAYLDAQKSWPS